jgi:ADP-ribose pyrophosphatase
MNQSEQQMLKEQKASLTSETAYQGRFITVRRETYQWKDEPSHVCDIVEHPGAVAILPITSDGRLLLIRQWRRAAREIMIEVPAGILEKGEDILACAGRELQEETGYRAREITPLGFFYTTPGFTNEKLYLFIGKDLEEAPLPPDAHEAIDLHPLSLDEALGLIESGGINDAKTIVAILRYARRQP